VEEGAWASVVTRNIEHIQFLQRNSVALCLYNDEVRKSQTMKPLRLASARVALRPPSSGVFPGYKTKRHRPRGESALPRHTAFLMLGARAKQGTAAPS